MTNTVNGGTGVPINPLVYGTAWYTTSISQRMSRTQSAVSQIVLTLEAVHIYTRTYTASMGVESSKKKNSGRSLARLALPVVAMLSDSGMRF